MSGLSVTFSSNRLEDLPQITAQHIIARGQSKIGCSLVSKMHLDIYPDKARVMTIISDYSSLPFEEEDMKKWINSYFLKVPALSIGTPMFVSIPGPILHREGMSQKEYDALVETRAGTVQYPLVKSWTWENSLEVPVNSEVQELLTDVKHIVTKFFPNQKESPKIPELHQNIFSEEPRGESMEIAGEVEPD